MVNAFAGFAEYTEYIHAEANTVLSGVRPSETGVDVFERFVSEWLDICGHNETMHAITMGIWHDAHPDDNPFYVQIRFAVGPNLYVLRRYSLGDWDALACWIKISFIVKMTRYLLDPEEAGTIFQIKAVFCEVWATLQHENGETRDIDFRRFWTPGYDGRYARSDYLVARDTTTLQQTRDMLWPALELRDNTEMEARMLWESGTDARRRHD